MKYVSLMLWVVTVSSLFLLGCAPKVADEAGVPTEGVEQPAPDLEGTMEKVVDTQTSVLNREGRKVTGKHRWRVFLKNGSMTFVDGVPTAGSFTMDMNSITVDDNNETVFKHLRSDDFFSVEKYPESTLVVTSVQPTELPHEYLMTADLTIKGITNPVTFVAKFAPDRSNATASFQIDRTLRNIQFRSAKFFNDLKDTAIDDQVDFDVTLNLQ